MQLVSRAPQEDAPWPASADKHSWGDVCTGPPAASLCDDGPWSNFRRLSEAGIQKASLLPVGWQNSRSCLDDARSADAAAQAHTQTSTHLHKSAGTTRCPLPTWIYTAISWYASEPSEAVLTLAQLNFHPPNRSHSTHNTFTRDHARRHLVQLLKARSALHGHQVPTPSQLNPSRALSLSNLLRRNEGVQYS